jgi:uncharacterized coiled-coil protein SlyX
MIKLQRQSTVENRLNILETAMCTEVASDKDMKDLDKKQHKVIADLSKEMSKMITQQAKVIEQLSKEVAALKCQLAHVIVEQNQDHSFPRMNEHGFG